MNASITLTVRLLLNLVSMDVPTLTLVVNAQAVRLSLLQNVAECIWNSSAIQAAVTADQSQENIGLLQKVQNSTANVARVENI